MRQRLRCLKAEADGRDARATMRRAQIETVVGRVLRNQINFLHAIGNQRLRLGDDVRLLPAAVRTAHPGNDAEAARVIAALGDFDVGKMARRQAKSRRGKVGDEGGTLVDFQQRSSSSSFASIVLD